MSIPLIFAFSRKTTSSISGAKHKRAVPMNKTYTWWKFLCITAGVNILAWLGAIWMQSDMQSFSYWQPVLSGIYVMVCVFRSFFPRIDVERYCLFDTPVSSVILGRTFATIAEICFSVQIAFLIYDLGVLLNSPAIVLVSYSLVPIIVFAQVCCWYATLTLNHFWHGVEEFAWVVMILLAAGCFIEGFAVLSGFNKILMSIGLISCLGGAYIMVFLDIPMYFSRQEHEVKLGVKYLTLSEGIQDAINRRVQTND